MLSFCIVHGYTTQVVAPKGGKKSASKANNNSLLHKSKKFNDQYSRKHNNNGFRRQPSTKIAKFPKAMSKKQSLIEACVELGIDPKVADITSSLPSHAFSNAQRQLTNKANQIFDYWKNTKQSSPLDECWNVQTGGFVREALGASASYNGSKGNTSYNCVDGEEEYHVPIHCILDWLKKDDNTVTDVNAGRIKSLYNGLREIPTDAKSILESLVDLSCPKSLYKIPLLTPYAVARRSSGQPGGGIVLWKIRIGLYMNRLLPEVLTSNNLHIVMSALEEGSYIVSEPLHMPPMRDGNDPVFQSSKYPIVTMPGAEKCIDVNDNDGDMSMGGEEKKVEDEDVPMDPTVIGSTRESKTISPFTPRGLLKLMENTGNDISMVCLLRSLVGPSLFVASSHCKEISRYIHLLLQYPELAQKLAPYLKLDLMLHQKHALCWM